MTDVNIWPISPLGIVVKAHILFFFFFFPLPVMLLSEIPELPTKPLVRGFPGVSKLLLLQDSLPKTGLHP